MKCVSCAKGEFYIQNRETKRQKDSKGLRAFLSYSPRKNQGKMFLEFLTLFRIKTGDFFYISILSLHGRVS